MRSTTTPFGVLLFALLIPGSASAELSGPTNLRTSFDGGKTRYALDLDYSGFPTPSPDFVLTLYSSFPSACAQPGIASQTVSMISGEHGRFFFETQGLPISTNNFFVWGDASCVFPGLDTFENLGAVPVAPPPTGVELMAWNTTATYHTVPLETVYQVEVCNRGQTSVGAGTYAIGVHRNLSSPLACGLTPDLTAPGPALAATSCTTVSFTGAGWVTGVFPVTVVDWQCALSPTLAQRLWDVSPIDGAPFGPDITVEDAIANVSGDAITYEGKVCNRGVSGPTFPTVALVHDAASSPACPSAGDEVTQLGPLGQDECAPFSFAWNQAPIGTHMSWLVADPICQISNELDRSNNAVSLNVSVDDPATVSSASAGGATTSNTTGATGGDSTMSTVSAGGAGSGGGGTGGAGEDDFDGPSPAAGCACDVTARANAHAWGWAACFAVLVGLRRRRAV